MKIITYLQEDGTQATIYPTDEAAALLGVRFVALKDVPFGAPFQIVEDGNVVEIGVGADVGAGARWTVTAATVVGGDVWVRCIDTELQEQDFNMGPVQ